MPDAVWKLVHQERAALIEDLSHLTDAQWQHPSLCAEWTIHDVAAHLVDTHRTTRLSFITALALARFDFDRQNTRGMLRHRAPTPAETLQRLRDSATRTSTPPAPLDSRLVEEVIHGEDIRRPLNLTRTYPPEAVTRALLLQARTPAAFGGAKELLTQIHLTATDSDISIGSGPQLQGPTLDLLLAISGRRIALANLTGPGLTAFD